MHHKTLAAVSLAALMLFVGAGCGPAERNPAPIVIQDQHVYDSQTNIPPTQDIPVPPPTGANGVIIKARLGTGVTLATGETAEYPDGLTVVLKEIHDSRCPADVQCVWAGELAPVLVVMGGKLTAPSTIQLGTSRAPSGESDAYVITLDDATASSATLTVKAKPPAAAKTEPKN
jgi:hypothetical protein